MGPHFGKQGLRKSHGQGSTETFANRGDDDEVLTQGHEMKESRQQRQRKGAAQGRNGIQG